VLHQRMLVGLRLEPEDDHVAEAFARLGINGVGARSAEEDERPAAHLVHGIVTRTVDDRHVRETERKLVHVLHPRLPVSGHARKPRREALALHETNARRGTGSSSSFAPSWISPGQGFPTRAAVPRSDR